MWSRRQVGYLLSLARLALADPSRPSPWSVAWRSSTQTLHQLAVSKDGTVYVIAGPAAKPQLMVRERQSWTRRPLPEASHSLFPLVDGLCWLAGLSGIWHSRDGGGSWTKQWPAEGIKHLCFADERRGYAVGANKTVIFTTDGGESWNPLDVAAEPRTTPQFTTYHWVDFVTPRVGVITGCSRPPRSGTTNEMPAWRDPSRASRRPEWPGVTIILETRDGLNWKHTSVSLFGQINRVKYSRGGRGLSLVEFHDAFEYPSEVFAINLRNGQSERVYREKEIAITDIALTHSEGFGVLAGICVPVDPAQDETGRVVILSSEDLKQWRLESIPEGLAARKVFLAGFEAANLWAATDTGVILQRSA
ncbi:MAG: hypothetical protein NZV14_12370 [Bryobacteraceae bacterium]|nr:hypothetical protein [Bryobacteraceae bacterium]MDW8378948.1 hypothetical protein [Bryobacterales bacterium]